MAAVEPMTGRIDTSKSRPFAEVKKNFTRFREGDVLFAKITPCMENGKIAVARGLSGGIGCGTTEFHVLRPTEAVLADYLRYFLVRSAFRREAQRNMQGAVGQQRVPAEFLRESRLPVPPIAEQQRIVSRIDELFSAVDDGERALQRTRLLVERYRQSVLKAAVTGALTAGDRALDDSLGEIEVLDGCVLVEPKTHRHAHRMSERRPPVQEGLAALPSGWAWARAESVCEFITKGTTPAKSAMRTREPGVPFIKVHNLTFNGLLNFSIDPTFVDESTHLGALARSKLVPGDVVMNIVGPPLGKVSIVPNTYREWNMNQAVCVFRALGELDRHFLAYHLMSRVAQDWLISKAKATVGQVNLTLEICRELPVPIPPLTEQRRIGQIETTELARLDQLMTSLGVESARAKSLRQAVLRSALSGDLVPQDADDEPAAELLARIATEVSTAQDSPRARRHRAERASLNRVPPAFDAR